MVYTLYNNMNSNYIKTVSKMTRQFAVSAGAFSLPAVSFSQCPPGYILERGEGGEEREGEGRGGDGKRGEVRGGKGDGKRGEWRGGGKGRGMEDDKVILETDGIINHLSYSALSLQLDPFCQPVVKGEVPGHSAADGHHQLHQKTAGRSCHPDPPAVAAPRPLPECWPPLSRTSGHPHPHLLGVSHGHP